MGEAIGKLLICDRCGATVFLEHTGTLEFDGGYTRRESYERPPEGWEIHEVPGELVNSIKKRLCPNCTEEYKKRLRGFMVVMNDA